MSQVNVKKSRNYYKNLNNHQEAPFDHSLLDLYMDMGHIVGVPLVSLCPYKELVDSDIDQSHWEYSFFARRKDMHGWFMLGNKRTHESPRSLESSIHILMLKVLFGILNGYPNMKAQMIIRIIEDKFRYNIMHALRIHTKTKQIGGDLNVNVFKKGATKATIIK
ncbi:hypothetical protein ACJX0J_020926 [Zea mays]